MIALLAGAMSACTNNETILSGDERGGVENGIGTVDASLRLTTRNGDGDGEAVNWPVHIYAFRGEACAAVATVTDGDGSYSMRLPEGTYDFYAIGGASDDDYTLPTKDDAAPTSVIALKENKNHTDLSAAAVRNVTLRSGESNTQPLELVRKVLMLQTVTITQVPTEATAVSVTVSPLSEAIKLNGGYSGTGNVTVDLTKQSDGTTWQKAVNAYLLPSEADATVTIAITTADGTQRYAYPVGGPLTTNEKYVLRGNYKAPSLLEVTLTLQAWGDDVAVNFGFNETNRDDDDNGGGISNDNNDNQDNTIPAVGDTWRGCYVLAVTDDAGGQTTDVTIISPTELTGWYNASEVTMATNIATALASITDGGSGIDWHVPNRDEAKLMFMAKEALSLTGKYLINHNGYRLLNPNSSGFTVAIGSDAKPDASTKLRPVAVVTVARE